jgi:predicted ATP-grasp superfamily ATP-dependent carboligase
MVQFLIDLARPHRERPVLFLTEDSSLVALHGHREELERWYRFPHAPWPVLKRIVNKDQLYRDLDGVVPIPRTRAAGGEASLDEVAREIGFPAIVKPPLRCRSGAPAGSVPFERIFGDKAVRVSSLDELQAVSRRARRHGFSVLVQEEIDGPVSLLYSVGLYATRGGAVPAAFTSQKLGQAPPDFGDGLVVRAVRAPQLVPLATAALRRFGYYGMADIEFKADLRAGTYKLLDINPRPWLWINLPTACGVNLPYAAFLDAVDHRVDPAAFVQHDFTTRWVSARGALVHLGRSLAAGRAPRGLLGALGRAGGRRVGPLLHRHDLLVRMFLSPRYWRDVLQTLKVRRRQASTLVQEH